MTSSRMRQNDYELLIQDSNVYSTIHNAYQNRTCTPRQYVYLLVIIYTYLVPKRRIVTINSKNQQKQYCEEYWKRLIQRCEHCGRGFLATFLYVRCSLNLWCFQVRDATAGFDFCQKLFDSLVVLNETRGMAYFVPLRIKKLPNLDRVSIDSCVSGIWGSVALNGEFRPKTTNRSKQRNQFWWIVK